MNKILAQDFFNYIVERQRIYKVKSNGMPPPWTVDPVLQKYKFCNVYRKNDACSKVLIGYVCLNNELSLADKIFNIMLFRRFNVRNFFPEIWGYPKSTKHFDFAQKMIELDDLKFVGIKLFNDAYTLCQVPFDSSTMPRCKHVQILLSMKSLVEGGFFEVFADSMENESAEMLFKILQPTFPKSHGIGPFLAYQILQDISYIPGIKIPELESFVYVGPGAIGGIELIFGSKESPEASCKLLQSMQMQYLPKVWFSDLCDKEEPLLNLANAQAGLCEWRKYVNLSKGKGRRRIYKHG